MSSDDVPFDLAAAREYWKYAPSGLGKINSEELLQISDDGKFLEEWKRQFASRYNHYTEEKYFNRILAQRFSGKDVLSFGSGLGFNEVQFLRAGARVRCVDIVESNLGVIERVCKLERLDCLTTLHTLDPSTEHYGAPVDFVYAWGSLMTMPFSMQAQVVERFKSVLKPNGQLILLLYTRAFLDAYCDRDSPVLFARASDPSVGDCHNPWSDWHDDGKLEKLIGPEMLISQRQLWNEDLYVTYGVSWRDALNGKDSPCTAFFDLAQKLEEGPILWESNMADIEILAAEGSRLPGGSVRVVTHRNEYGYAAGFHPHALRPRHEYFVLSLDAEIESGAFSVGLLDIDRNAFTFSRAVNAPGRKIHGFSVGREQMPRHWKLILSNHRNEAEASTFILHRIVLRGGT